MGKRAYIARIRKNETDFWNEAVRLRWNRRPASGSLSFCELARRTSMGTVGVPDLGSAMDCAASATACLSYLSSEASQPGFKGSHMVESTFELNGKPMSVFEINALKFPAFSGLGEHKNRREFACIAGVGPIPPGVYYILDRQSGGRLGPLLDLIKDRSGWFALYAADKHIDDEVFCNTVKRGNFRLHPAGTGGISQGCITLTNQIDFSVLRNQLIAGGKIPIPGTALHAYGRVTVK
jgi:hypothetical protein